MQIMRDEKRMKPEWNVFVENINAGRIETYNIFDHSGFRRECSELLMAVHDKEIFREKMKSSLQYFFWAKCEWEVVVTSLTGEKAKIKIDVFKQVMMNYDSFVDYVWNNIENIICAEK